MFPLDCAASLMIPHNGYPASQNKNVLYILTLFPEARKQFLDIASNNTGGLCDSDQNLIWS